MKRKSNAELGAMALGETGPGSKKAAKKKASKKKKTCGSMGELVLAVQTIKKAQNIITGGGIRVTSGPSKATKKKGSKKSSSKTTKKKRSKKSKKKSPF